MKQHNLPIPHFQRAFTLIEMLVVMVIVGLMATLIVQGFGYSLGLYQKVIKSQRAAYTEVLAYGWFNATLATQVPARPKDRGLEGAAMSLSTYSLQPLVGVSGLKTRIQWQLVNKDDGLNLEYGEAATQFSVLHWPDSRGQFEYLDDKGKWHSEWPTEKSDLLPLPEAVRLVVMTGKESRNYVVSVKTRKRAEVTMDEAMYGR